jgi:hypothetical protein
MKKIYAILLVVILTLGASVSMANEQNLQVFSV